MKRVAAALLIATVGLAVFPILFASGDIPATVVCSAPAGSGDAALATIRHVESGGDYRARAGGSSASGAYQFADATWAGYGGYTAAWMAPPATQDAKAAASVARIRSGAGNDISAVPVVWYLGHLPPAGSPEWDTVPSRNAGNRLTPRQYQARWMAVYQAEQRKAGPKRGSTISGTGVASAPGAGPADPAPGCAPGPAAAPSPGGWSLPGPASLFGVAPVDRPHHDYPAWDWPVPQGTPVYAVRGGRVISVHPWPYNWFDHGCTNGQGGCDKCGIGLTVQDDQGTRWNYCHGSAIHAAQGQTVAAGSQILTSGNTGRSTGPHVHLGITTADGAARCPQPLLRSLQQSGSGSDPAGLPTSGCTS